VVFFDYHKAFDLIDHAILARKLTSLDIPYSTFWIINFLKDCKQTEIKLDCDFMSEWKDVLAGVPQGTKLGPRLFILMIDDVGALDIDLWKYVDDTMIAKPIAKNRANKIQDAVNDLIPISPQ